MDIFSAQEFCFLQAPGQKKTEVPSGASVFSAKIKPELSKAGQDHHLSKLPIQGYALG